MLEVALAVALTVAAGAIGVAYGYRGQRDAALEQVTYLRKQLAIGGDPAPSNSRQLQVAGGPR